MEQIALRYYAMRHHQNSTYDGVQMDRTEQRAMPLPLAAQRIN